jgi:excisionase family DNA binding protein
MKHISVEEAAAILHISGRRVRALIGTGRLSAERVGLRTFVLGQEAVEEFGRTPRSAGRPPSGASKAGCAGADRASR